MNVDVFCIWFDLIWGDTLVLFASLFSWTYFLFTYNLFTSASILILFPRLQLCWIISTGVGFSRHTNLGKGYGNYRKGVWQQSPDLCRLIKKCQVLSYFCLIYYIPSTLPYLFIHILLFPIEVITCWWVSATGQQQIKQNELELRTPREN